MAPMTWAKTLEVVEVTDLPVVLDLVVACSSTGSIFILLHDLELKELQIVLEWLLYCGNSDHLVAWQVLGWIKV